MKTLNFPKLYFTKPFPDLRIISGIIEERGVKSEINELNWKSYKYRPEVFFFSAYTQNEILLKYRVKENYILAMHTAINSSVHEDSCVEFFISSDKESYYNFEFNCVGTPKVGYGLRREGRLLIDNEKVSQIRTYSTLCGKQIPVKKIDEPWELTVAIPFSIFSEKEFLAPGEHQFSANFYKCGDKLPIPHFLSWNPIRVKAPDFHRKEYFGEIRFV